MAWFSGGEGEEGEGEEAGKGGQGEQVARIRERGNGGNGAHGILGTQLGGTQQQPHIQHTQVAPVELTVWSGKSKSRIVVPIE